jgi:hypothetical protein
MNLIPFLVEKDRKIERADTWYSPRFDENIPDENHIKIEKLDLFIPIP